MGSKDPEAGGEDAPRERKHHSSKTDKERKEKKEKKKSSSSTGDRIHKSSSTRSSTKHRTSSKLSALQDDDASNTSSSKSRHGRRTREEKERDRERERERKVASMSDLNTIPELSRTDSRSSLPYPSFSKAHSKENVSGGGSSVRERGSAASEPHAASSSRRDDDDPPLTPEPTNTDLGSSEKKKKHRKKRRSASADDDQENDRPPSPPETDLSAEKRRMKTPVSQLRDEERPRSRSSGLSRSSSRHDDRSKLSSKSRASSQATYVRAPSRPPPPPPGIEIVDEDSVLSDDRTAGARSSRASRAPSAGPKRTASRRSARPASPVEEDDSPESIQDSSPRTPTVATPPFPRGQRSSGKFEQPSERPTPTATPATDFGDPPPPPPPPPLDIQDVPRVDYLLQHGGLQQAIPRKFLSALPRQDVMRLSANSTLIGPETLFAPFFNVLDQYNTVLQGQGSIAVATGHKSVARRLLDRLEDVFSRDLPAEGCRCIMCEEEPDEHPGLGWGEVLERVGGRVDLPAWPPFDLAATAAAAAEDTADLPPRPSSPIKLDPDIAEEFRDHYLRQSKKVRSAVDKWMNSCAEAPAPAPADIDDETLAFAVMTNLDQEEQPYFNALISGARELQPCLRAPTPMRKPRTDFMVKMGLALQRIYRLPSAPRDAETAVFLVRNPGHHDLLATITDISPQEWEILISGRFDGFLWSGADSDEGLTPTLERSGSRASGASFFSPPPSRQSMRQPTPGFSRSTTPFSGVYSRGATPASFISLSSSNATNYNRQPVSHDEEIEVAALAEVEREIYQGMEALEDAFEKLHHRAEIVRNALRERNAGLSMSLQSRRAQRIDVLPQLSGNSSQYERPAWATDDDDRAGVSDSEWGGDDIDLFPEDSASNISSSRHRRPKRRTERRTPAPIEEDDEEN